jgi:hypothetical protein
MTAPLFGSGSWPAWIASVSNFIQSPVIFNRQWSSGNLVTTNIIRGNMTKTILAVLAHPDDESFGIGGTLALYSRKGYETYLVCATRGEEGSMDEEHLNGYKDKAELRTHELQNAPNTLA